MNNVAGAVEVGLSLFGGLDTELSPSDLPQGLSPANLNCAFIPGAVFTRPGLVQASTIPAAGQIVYMSSFVNPAGEEIVLQFGSNGAIYANGVQIGQTKAGNRFKVASLFGRAYIAISDGDHGADVPLQYDGQYLDRVSQDGPGAPPAVANMSLPAVSTSGNLTRTKNVVTTATTGAHGLKIGNQFTLAGSTAETIGGGVASLVIDNTNYPGLATITMNSAHGLIPDDQITLSGVQNVQVGGGVVDIVLNGEQATVTTQTPNGVQVGATLIVQTSGNRPASWTVSSVISPTQFTYVTSQTSGTFEGGEITLIWPGNENTTNLYTVQTVTSATSFTVPITYSDGTWTSGTVTFAWDGTFYVLSVPSPMEITYTQTGPDGTTSGGTITPLGQIAPGPHQCVCIFQTRTGYTTIPSPPVTFTADGGQYLQVTNIPIGPSNVVARILAFTGANGAKFFYLPILPQVNGQVVGTSTVIPDNTTTSAVLDFGDTSLFDGLGIDIEGNNLFRQVVLGPCAAFYPYAGRLFAWGERNKVQGFLNMGFEGGTVAANIPLGWTLTGSGTLSQSPDYGVAWNPAAGATIAQSAYQTSYGAPILTGNTQYTFRAYVNGTVTASLVSASVGILATATITAAGDFAEAAFSVKTPPSIPADTQLQLLGGLMDEVELYYTQNPYLKFARASYIDNAEAFDGVTGQIGSASDPNALRSMYIRRDVLHLLTDGPNGSLYETQDSASAEPSNWNVQMVATKCGATSIWGDAQFEDWQVWASDTGLRIYDGGSVEKMSQEVQTWWDTINPAYRNLAVVSNDPYTRRIYILVPVGNSSVPNSTYVLDYRELNTAGAMSSSTPLRVVYSGKMLTTDLTRKWSPWSLQANYCAMVGNGDAAVMTFCGGGIPQLGATYTLVENVLSGIDADYGPFQSYYATYYLLSAYEAQGMKLSPHRKDFGPLSLNISGQGAVTVTPWVNQNGNEWRTTRPVPMRLNSVFDLLFPVSVSADRVSFKITAQPSPRPMIGAENVQAAFYLAGMTVAMKDHPYSGLRGSNN